MVIPKSRNWDRAVGALVGLAVGDAIGTTLENSKRDSAPPVTDMVGGGPFDLRPGEWTDDTAMALCLADSLRACDGLDQSDLLRRFGRWLRYGDNSCTGSCFGAGNTTFEAIRQFDKTGNPVSDLSGSGINPGMAGNGSLTRLAPAVIYLHRDRAAAVSAARDQSATTHGAPAAIEACAYFAHLLLDAIDGLPQEQVLRPRPWPDNKDVDAIAQGSWIGKPRSEIRSSGNVIDTLEAALWSVAQADNFRDCVLIAANLGDDADTVAAVTGQLAASLWGTSGIPAEWVRRLAWSLRIRKLGAALYDGRNPVPNTSKNFHELR
jgi:ADP-ribosyl-[dinitrogen reductase] hydrolase